MRFARILPVLALMMHLATPASAQLRTSLDVGAASVTYEGGYRVGAMSITPMLDLDGARASLFATGSFSRFETGSYSTSGIAGASVLSSRTSRVRAELAALIGGSAPGDGIRAGRYLGQVRLHLLGGRGGMWLGAGSGQSWYGDTARLARVAEGGAWWRPGAGVLLVAALEPSRVGDSSHTDARASVHWERGALELGGTAGFRSGAFAGSSTWQAVSGTWWLGRFVALNASAGSYVADPFQSTPGGRYVTVGLRLATHRPSVETAADLRRAARARMLARPAADGLEIRSGANEQRIILIDAPRARRVELMGDFTEWRIVALSRVQDGRWQLATPVAVGTHRFNIRIDGGEWGVPRGVTMITDDFEGVVGILTIR